MPQLKLSGSPRPRNESSVSAVIASATTRMVLAKISGKTLGRTCLFMMCMSREPMALARSMKGSSRTRSASARTTRAVPGQLVTPMMTITMT